jgi:CubicO group peptidase (beta-lactamase class C family)
MVSDIEIADLVRKAMKAFHVTGASISIINDHQPASVKHFGFSDKTNKILVDDSTLFKIGSITKVFTASAVMQLVEQNKIDVDKPIKEYLPEFSVKSRFESSNSITIRDILCHHSGLPCDNLSGYFTENLEAFHSVIPFLNNAYTVCPPGQMFYYSNVGYELLGVLISRISGVPFHEYIDTVLLKGTGMFDSAISLSDEKRKTLSKPYRKGKQQVETMMKGLPEGGIHSTASDMAIFMDSLLNSGKNIFNRPDTLEAMLTSQYPGNPMDMSFVNGLGWFIGKPGLDHGGKVIWHDGGTPNFFSLMVLIPQRKLGLTILTNSSTGALMNHALSVEILRLLLNENHRITVPTSQETPHPDISPQKMRSMTGRFYSISGIINVFISGKHLIAKLPSGTFRLKPHSDGWFGVIFMLFGFLPLNLKKLAMVSIGVSEINGEKVFAFEQLGFRSAQGQQYRLLRSSEVWKQRTGEYVCVNEKSPRLKSFKLIDTPDGLALSAVVDKIGRLKLFLDVVNDSEAITMGFGRYTSETIHGFEDTLTVFGLQFKKNR